MMQNAEKNEHLRAIRRRNPNHPVVEHHNDAHPEVQEIEVIFKVIRFHEKPLERQAHEGYLIANSKGHILISRGDWGQNLAPRLIVEDYRLEQRSGRIGQLQQDPSFGAPTSRETVHSEVTDAEGQQAPQSHSSETADTTEETEIITSEETNTEGQPVSRSLRNRTQSAEGQDRAKVKVKAKILTVKEMMMRHKRGVSTDKVPSSPSYALIETSRTMDANSSKEMESKANRGFRHKRPHPEPLQKTSEYLHPPVRGSRVEETKHQLAINFTRSHSLTSRNEDLTSEMGENGEVNKRGKAPIECDVAKKTQQQKPKASSDEEYGRPVGHSGGLGGAHKWTQIPN